MKGSYLISAFSASYRTLSFANLAPLLRGGVRVEWGEGWTCHKDEARRRAGWQGRTMGEGGGAAACGTCAGSRKRVCGADGRAWRAHVCHGWWLHPPSRTHPRAAAEAGGGRLRESSRPVLAQPCQCQACRVPRTWPFLTMRGQDHNDCSCTLPTRTVCKFKCCSTVAAPPPSHPPRRRRRPHPLDKSRHLLRPIGREAVAIDLALQPAIVLQRKVRAERLDNLLHGRVHGGAGGWERAGGLRERGLQNAKSVAAGG